MVEGVGAAVIVVEVVEVVEVRELIEVVQVVGYRQRLAAKVAYAG